MAIRAEDIDMEADRSLVERYQAGDERAFDELYARYFDRLRCFCQRKVGDRGEAEEIAQEAFVKALGALPRFAGDRRFYPWMTVIASRLCVDHFRRQARVRPAEDVDPGVDDVDLGRDLVHQAEVADLDAALLRITARHRTVLELRERRGLSYAEIAADLEVPQTTVETLLFRARKALRREYLAVSGDTGRLVGIPVLGWLGLRLRSLRQHVGDVRPELAQLAAPLAAGVAAVTVTAGLVVGGTPPAEQDLVTRSPSPVAAPPAPRPGPPVPVAAGTPAPADLPAPAPAPAPAVEDVAGTDRPAPPPEETVTVVPGATISRGDPEAFDEAEEMPVATPPGPATIAADPVLGVDALVHQLFGGSP